MVWKRWAAVLAISALSTIPAAPAANAEPPPMEVGALSRKGGGFLPRHVSHREGRDVDVYVYAAKGTPQDICAPGYARNLTATLAQVFASNEKVEVIFSGDPHLPGTVYWRGLREHLHVRMTPNRAKRLTMSADLLERARADYEAICAGSPADALPEEPGDKLLIKRALAVNAATLIAPSPELEKTTVPLRGTIGDYIAAVARTNGVGVLGRPQIVSCAPGAARCVRLTGAPCARAKKKDGCEGVALTVTIGSAEGKAILIDALGPDLAPVRTQADVERLIALSP